MSSPTVGTLVDSNVRLDLFSENPQWLRGSEAKLAPLPDFSIGAQ